MPMPDDDPTSVLLQDADPARFLGSVDLDDALDAIGQRIRSEPATPRDRRRVPRRGVAAGVALAAVLAAGAPAAATWVSARTGWFGDPHHTEEDGSEWIRLDALGLPAVVRADVRQLGFDLPDGVTQDDVVSGTLRRVAVEGGTGPQRMQEGALRNVVGWEVACRWGSVWLDAADPSQASTARSRMRDIARRVDALPAAQAADDGALRSQLRANCDVEASR